MKLDSKPIRELVLEHFVPESALQETKKELMRKSRSKRDDLELYIRIESQVIRKNPKFTFKGKSMLKGNQEKRKSELRGGSGSVEK